MRRAQVASLLCFAGCISLGSGLAAAERHRPLWLIAVLIIGAVVLMTPQVTAAGKSLRALCRQMKKKP